MSIQKMKNTPFTAFENKRKDIYDAAYIWLARKAEEPVLTMDKRLARLVESVHPEQL